MAVKMQLLWPLPPGKQLLPLSSSLHGGVSQLVLPQPGEPNNLVRMRSQSLGQSAPALTAGLVSSASILGQLVAPCLKVHGHVTADKFCLMLRRNLP